MERSTSQIVGAYVSNVGKNILIFILALATAGLYGAVFMGVVQVLTLGTGSFEQSVIILFKIGIPIFIGLVVWLHLRGFLNFLKYGWQFVDDIEIYTSITELWVWIAGAFTIFLVIGACLVLDSLIAGPLEQFILVSMLLGVALAGFLIGLIQRVRFEKYKQGILQKLDSL